MIAMRSYTITPTIDTNAYTSGDQLGPDSTKLSRVVDPGGYANLVGVDVIDIDGQSAGFDILFFNAEPTVASSNNAAIDVADAEMTAKFCGVFTVASSDYKAAASNSVASVRDVHTLKSAKSSTNPEGRDFWVTLVVRGTPTYTTTTSLKLVLHFNV